MNEVDSETSVQSPLELSPPETQNSTSSLMTTGTLTSSSDKLLNMISPEENSGVSNLSPSPSPPHSPSVQSSLLGSNKKLISHHQQKYNINNNNNNNVSTFNGRGGGGGDMGSSISSNGTSSASYNLNNNNDFDMMESSNVEVVAANCDSLTKSKSNESQLSMNGRQTQHQLHQTNGSAMSSSVEISTSDSAPPPPIPAPRTKYPISSSHYHHHENNAENYNSVGSMATPIIISESSTIPPRSPCTPVRAMGHMIQHRFTKKFKFTTRTCDLCNKQMFSFGFKCTECKYRCHKDCKSNVPPSCGLPKEFVDEFKKIYLNSDGMMPNNASPSLPRGPGLMPTKRNESRHRAQMHPNIPFHGADSSSAGSSCNSSSPSSPALLTIPPQTPANKSQFNFPEVSSSGGVGTSSSSVPSSSSINNNNNINNNNSNFSSYPNTIIEDAEFDVNQHQHHHHRHGHSKLIEKNGIVILRNNYHHSLTSPITTANGQIINSSFIDSTESDKTTMSTESDRMTPRLESVEEHESSWPRQNSLSLKEWDIPYNDLNIGNVIGEGRFGTVYRGNWHGDVAVKLFKENFLNDEHAIEAFKLEVAIFKNTRHENLVLFMGACMKPPKLAIVTSLCKGNTLYTHVHLRRDKFNLNKTTLIAQQIAQGKLIFINNILKISKFFSL